VEMVLLHTLYYYLCEEEYRQRQPWYFVKGGYALVLDPPSWLPYNTKL